VRSARRGVEGHGGATAGHELGVVVQQGVADVDVVEEHQVVIGPAFVHHAVADVDRC
jgi:hypothetical protein